MLEAIVERLPPPKGDPDKPLKALLIDSWYDAYLGVIVLVRIIDGTLKKGQKVKLMPTGGSYQVERVGIFRPKQEMLDSWGRARSGSSPPPSSRWPTRASATPSRTSSNPTAEPLPGFKPAQPVVFCGLFPVDAADFEDLREAMARLRLNDASFSYETETSAALGFGFRCGFLGLLHLEIITERLEREFNLDLITTAPSVIYHIHMNDGTMIEMHNPADMPDAVKIDHIEEPWIEATILVPDEYLGAVLKLCQDRRGRQKNLTYAGSRAMLVYELPLNEVVFDFYDRLKSVSRGYASFDYHMMGYEEGDLVKMSILVNAEPVDALSIIVHRTRAESRGRSMCEKLKDLIPPHLFSDPDPGGDRRQGHRARDHPGAAQGRASPSATAATSRESASCSRSRRPARRRCASSARSKSRRKPSSPRSRWTRIEESVPLSTVEAPLGGPDTDGDRL